MLISISVHIYTPALAVHPPFQLQSADAHTGTGDDNLGLLLWRTAFALLFFSPKGVGTFHYSIGGQWGCL